MGIGRTRGNNTGFGNLTTLRVISPTNSTTDNKNKIPKPTRTIKISEQLYRRFVGHSQKFYNVESYETILSDLLESYSKYHEPDYSHIHSNE